MREHLPPLSGGLLAAVALRAMPRGATPGSDEILSGNPEWRQVAERLTRRQHEFDRDDDAKQAVWVLVQTVLPHWERTSGGTDAWMALFAAMRDIYSLDDQGLLAVMRRVGKMNVGL